MLPLFWLDIVLPAEPTPTKASFWLECSALFAGLALTVAFSVPLFGHRLFYDPRVNAQGVLLEGVSAWGKIGGMTAAGYLLWTFVLFWQERRRRGDRVLALSVLILTIGIVLGGVLNTPFPFSMSVANALGVAILGCRVIGRRILNPLRERTDALQREIVERTRTEKEAERRTESFFGAVPEPISAAVQRALGIGSFTGLALLYGDELVGTAIVVMPAERPPIPTDVARTLAYVAAVSLRRKEAEDWPRSTACSLPHSGSRCC
jgi:hypothetical protein